MAQPRHSDGDSDAVRSLDSRTDGEAVATADGGFAVWICREDCSGAARSLRLALCRNSLWSTVMLSTVRALRPACLLTALALPGLCAQAPRNLGVSFNADGSDVPAPLAADTWHEVAARYQHPGRVEALTNTYLVFCRGGNPLTGFYVGYHLPSNQLAIVKHGYWNATEATGTPGEVGKVIENDQGYMDCEHTRVVRTADEVTVVYRLKFKSDVLQGACSVLQYIEDKDVNYDGFDHVASVVIGRDTAVHRTDMPRQWRNALKPKGRAAPSLRLAEDGRARYTLLVPEEPARIELKAAQDLAHCLTRICAAEFPILREGVSAQAEGPCISLGRTRRLGASAARWLDADLETEGYAIEVIDGDIFVYGGSGRGLIHGVYALLEEDLGCRWYALDSVDTPQARRLTAKLVPRKVLPPLELRDPYILRTHDSAWSLRNRTNTPHARIPQAWGGSIRYHHMGHTYAWYFPTERYFAEHPEYYALVDGKRQPSQLCHTNEEVIRLSIEKTCQIFRENPEVTITAIGPNDGRGFCDCPECRRLDDENGGRSGSYFHHLNQIAAGVKREFPNRRIISLAYLDYARPPTKLAVDDMIIIQLCTDSHAWRYQFCYAWESQEFQEMLKAWQAARATVYIWDYTTDYVHYLVPMANWAVVAGNTRFFLQHGVRGIMYESEANDNDELRAWVWSKQLWDPELDTKALLRDFVFGYYKEAAPPLWEYQMELWDYWQRWHKLPHRCGEPSDNPLLNTLNCSYAPDGPMFTDRFMASMRTCFAKAEKAARSDEIRARVQKAKVSLLYLELAQNLGYYTEFGDFAYGPKVRESRAAKEVFRQYLEEFEETVRRNQLATFGIPITFDKITTKWRSCIALDNPVLPKVDLPAEWLFATDPDDKGLAEAWYREPCFFAAAAKRPRFSIDLPKAPEGTSVRQLAWLHINRGVGWEQQGFPGFDGYGWYFQSVAIPEDAARREHVYLYFLGVNEEAWIYVNGELVCERSYASTGKAVGELRGVPISAEITRHLNPAGPNRIAVRVMHASGLGGILAPATLFCTDEECTTEQLAKYRD
jgi:hypothetical protein